MSLYSDFSKDFGKNFWIFAQSDQNFYNNKVITIKLSEFCHNFIIFYPENKKQSKNRIKRMGFLIDFLDTFNCDFVYQEQFNVFNAFFPSKTKL